MVLVLLFKDIYMTGKKVDLLFRIFDLQVVILEVILCQWEFSTLNSADFSMHRQKIVRMDSSWWYECSIDIIWPPRSIVPLTVMWHKNSRNGIAMRIYPHFGTHDGMSATNWYNMTSTLGGQKGQLWPRESNFREKKFDSKSELWIVPTDFKKKI